MRHLYLLRHVKSDWDDPALSDRDRPLAPRGKRAAAALAGYIERNGIAPALVLCSPARRTMDTLRLISGGLGAKVEILVEDELYGAGCEELLRRLRRLPAAAPSAMIIGHNPAMQELALTLTGDADNAKRLKGKYPTGALASLAVPDGWATLGSVRCELLDFVVPKELN